MLCFPPHCTHRLQPLDVSFMAPLSVYYGQEQKNWLRNNPGRVVTQYQISKLFGASYEKAATLQIATSGFRKTGIYPTDPNIFGEADFAAAETTEREISEQNLDSPISQSNVNLEEPGYQEQRTQSRSPDQEELRPATPQPGPSGLNTSVLQVVQNDTALSSSAFQTSSPKDLLPVPHAKRLSQQPTRKRGKTVVLTESPYKTELEEAIANQKQKKTQIVKRNLIGKTKTNKRKKLRNERSFSKSDDDEPSNNEVELCLYCGESYYETRRTDGWMQCTACSKWAHEGCTGLNDSDLFTFNCVRCISS